MPIEIRELVIKATVNDKDKSLSGIESLAGGNGRVGNQETVINEIVDRVFRILKQKTER